MNKCIIPISALCFFLAGAASAGEHAADHEKKMVVAVKTNDFELVETDISHLGVGESEIIQTEDGRTIDLLRTTEGVEIYLDGELVDLAGLHDGSGEHRVVKHRVKIICEGDEEESECEEKVWMSDDIDLEALHEEGEHVIMIHKLQHGESEVDIDEEIEIDADGRHKKIIVIKKHSETG
jgi:hypothetical protein